MKATRNRKAPQPVQGTCRWVGGIPSLAALDNGAAMLLIKPENKEPAAYHVQRLKDGENVVGYRLTKAGVENPVYDVEQIGDRFRCDCPDATHTDRPGGCKHVRSLRVALAAVSK
jgi:hypothetical protein